MKVQVLYFEGCPNHEPTMALVREVARELDLTIEIEPVLVTDGDDVRALRFLGSPTVRVGGRDVEPEARARTDYAFGCRVYGGTGTPPREMVRAALVEARAA